MQRRRQGQARTGRDIAPVYRHTRHYVVVLESTWKPAEESRQDRELAVAAVGEMI